MRKVKVTTLIDREGKIKKIMTSLELKQVTSNIWVKEEPFKSLGIEVGSRMTIIRLSGDNLVLISPVKLNSLAVSEINSLGTVKYIIAPNVFHYLFLQTCQNIFPKASVITAPGLETRISQVKSDYVFTKDKIDFQGEIEYFLFEGVPSSIPTQSSTSNEIVFYHPESKTLILTDSAFYFDLSFPLMTQFASRIIGSYQKLRPLISNKLAIKDKKIITASFIKLLQWDFQRVIVAHGGIVEQNAKEQLISGYEWFLDTNFT